MDVAWILIIIAGMMEPMWVYTLERSDNFRDTKWARLTIAIVIVDLYLLSVSMRTIGAGLSYAIWTGIGAVTTFLMGITLFKESTSWMRIACIFVIVAGIVGLNIVSGGA